MDDFYIMADNSILHVPAPGVLRNDRDANGRPLTASLVNDVSFGSLTLLSSGAFLYWPQPDFVGEDSFTYVARDGLGDSDVARAIIIVDVNIKIIEVDIKPGLDPNPINLCSQGVLPVTILGSADCAVTEIDASSLLLEGQVAPLRWSLEDDADGYQYLRLEFDAEAVNNALRELRIGQTYKVWITGALTDGTPITGSDFIVVVPSSHLDEEEGPNDEKKAGPI